MTLSLISEKFQKHHEFPLKQKCFFEKSFIKNFMRIGIITVTILIGTSVQLLFALPGKSQPVDQVEVQIGLKNETLVQAFRKIEAQTPFHFMYRKEEVQNITGLNLADRKSSVGQTLKTLLSHTALTYRQVNNQILILPDKNWVSEVNLKNPMVLSVRSEALTYTAVANMVHGKVTNSNGEPLRGVSVTVKGATTGTSTDGFGNYSIDVPKNATLIFSFVGYSTRNIPVNSRSEINVVMEVSASSLNQVVVIGYGTTQKKDLTGSVAQVSNKDLQAVPVYNIGEALQGRASGVSVVSNSGEPGSRIQIRVRGGNSMIGSNDPLYVVDGFPLTGGIDFLNPADIESIDILKDASATAIYGARGANGVVIITTKRGSLREKSSISVNSYFGTQQVAKRFHLLNAKQYATVANEWLKNNGEQPFFNLDDVKNPGIDWQDAIFRTAPIQNHTLTFSGSGGKTNYSLSANYYKQEGIIINSGVQRGSFRLNLDHELKSWLKLSTNLDISRREQFSVPVNNGRRGNNMFSGALSAPPTVSIYDSSGLPTIIGQAYPFTDPGDMRNPMLWNKPYKDRTLSNNILLNDALNFQITKELSFNTRLGLEFENSQNDIFSPIIYQNDRGGAFSGNTYWNSFLNENILTYKKEFSHSQKLTVMGGVTYQTYMIRSTNISVSGFSNNVTENYNLGSAETVSPPSSGISEWQLISGLGRVNYSYGDKYFVTASLRSDGSSRFGKNNKWGIFPSGALAWRISEEPFMRENLDFISNLKLRASYGVTGNTALSPYQSLNRLSPEQYIYSGNTVSVGYAPSGISNNQLRWETSDELDLGLDLNIINNFVGFTFDYYKKNTNDLLASVPLPPSMGFGYILQNFGEIQNQGLEFSINANLFNKGFKWDVAAQLSTNKNKVLKIAGGSDVIPVGQTSGLPGYNIARVGEPLGMFYGYKEDGLDENGYIKYVDVNKDGSITPADRVILGSPYPNFEFGFNSDFSYKNFSLNVFLQGSYGNDIFFATAFTNLNSFQRTQNQFEDLYGNYWTEENPDPHAKYPRVSPLTQMRPSDRFIKDGSYLRMKSLQLSYELPIKTIGINWLSKATVYIKATNLFTLTNYPGLDPDVNTRGTDSQSIENRLFIGTDESGYPNAKVFGAGVNVSF
ncbi:MAG: SusC/RagA family TonB-linked outer membrane protein [Ginsengibacter sp.]